MYTIVWLTTPAHTRALGPISSRSCTSCPSLDFMGVSCPLLFLFLGLFGRFPILLRPLLACLLALPLRLLHQRFGVFPDAAQANVGEGLVRAVPDRLKTPVAKLLPERLLGADKLPAVLGPIHKAIPQVLEGIVLVLPHDAAFVEERLHRVLTAKVLFGRVSHDLLRLQSNPLPFQASLDHPSQDARPLGLKRVG